MKKSLHPTSKPVVFRDMMTGEAFLITSTVESGDSIVWEDGQTYPLVNVEISSRSHPAFTGKVEEERTSSRAANFKDKYSKSAIH